MKCPKCHYLGFETGDRCRNCGYDFSLIAAASGEVADLNEGPPEGGRYAGSAREFDLELQTSRRDDASDIAGWPLQQSGGPERRAEHSPSEKRDPPARTATTAPDLPLFTHETSVPDDEPLIKLPVTPRPPLAVRRAPETPRLHMVHKPPRRVEVAPALEFDDVSRTLRESSSAPAVGDPERERPARVQGEAAIATRGGRQAETVSPATTVTAGSPSARIAAAAIDFALLGAVDAAVVYFTLRVAGLGMADWNVLPVAPLAVFLLLLKLAYFSAFTAVGGQTIGKMALHIRVVTDGLVQPDAGVALRRTVIGAVSGACLGFGFVPAFFDPEGRAFHDRITRTRVVTLRTA